MSLSRQASDPESTLCRFLDTYLPQRQVVVQQWTEQVQTSPWAPQDVDADRRLLGISFEVRMGLDLAEEPACWDLLSFLPAGQCHDLLTAAGFAPATYDHLPADDTTDPLLLTWQRVSVPTQADDHAQHAALATCLDIAGIDEISHGAHRVRAAHLRRSLFLALRAAGFKQADEENPSFIGLHHMWNGYLRHGRSAIRALGDQAIIGPVLAPGFATADLSIGRTLVEIKTSIAPTDHLDVWLNQLLGYLLLDRLDIFRWNKISIHLGWQATTLKIDVPSLLSVASTGPTPALSDLRMIFHRAISSDLDRAAIHHFQKLYPALPI